MPSYTLKNQNDELSEVIMSWTELQNHLSEYPELKLMPSTPMLVSQQGTTLSKTSDGWKDLMKNMKQKAGRESTIKS